MDGDKPLRLRCRVQQYDWGKRGRDSLVARLIGYNDDKVPYAELWIGDHIKLPAWVEDSLEPGPLNEIIARNPSYILGDKVAYRFSGLPFLLKIISVGSALSVQAHPSRELAEVLHKKDPANYPDVNHKPELAIAITPVSLLHGFRPRERIMQDFARVPGIFGFLDETAQQILLLQSLSDREFMNLLFTALLNASPEVLAEAKDSLVKAIGQLPERTLVDDWVLRLKDRCRAGDPGFFCLYFLNFGTLLPGEAIFIPPNTPHAYLEGDLVECLANSDNVVRVGLTYKFIDVPTFLSMVDFESSKMTVIKTVKLAKGEPWRAYQVPAEEFSVAVLQGAYEYVTADTKGMVTLIFSLDAHGSLITADGSFQLAPGTALLLPAALGRYEISLETGTVYRISPGI